MTKFILVSCKFKCLLIMTSNSNLKKYMERDRRKERLSTSVPLPAFPLHFHFSLGPTNFVAGPVLTSHHTLSFPVPSPAAAPTFTTQDTRSLLRPLASLPFLFFFPPALPFLNQEQEHHCPLSLLTVPDKCHLLSHPASFS